MAKNKTTSNHVLPKLQPGIKVGSLVLAKWGHFFYLARVRAIRPIKRIVLIDWLQDGTYSEVGFLYLRLCPQEQALFDQWLEKSTCKVSGDKHKCFNGKCRSCKKSVPKFKTAA